MNYVSHIADLIIDQSGSNAVLGPDIYTAIAEWEKREIPITVVRKSIREVCGRKDESCNGNLPVDLFQSTVIRNFRQWLATEGRVAKSG